MTDKLAYLALRGIPGVGLVLFQRLVQTFGKAAAVFEASAAELAGVKGVSPAVAKAIVSFRDWDQVESQLDELKAQEVELVTQDDVGYPERLKNIPFAPPFLYVRGSLKGEDDLAVALVGTRQASHYGLRVSRSLARELAAQGVTIISGLARGIDTAAHQGALEAGGRTVAVLGCGLDVVYPRENREFYRRIPRQGALVSEFPLGTPPEPRNFPIRNRIISGLARGVVVVEAPLRSGALITVDRALDQGREVMAVPGPITSPTSAGGHRLIQQGAKLVHDVQDILEEISPTSPGVGKRATPGRPRLTTDDSLLAILGTEPLQLEELVQASGLSAPEVMSRLTMLELQGLIKELPGQCYVLEDCY